jgi:DNA-binding NarL/FixJ family response regulator
VISVAIVDDHSVVRAGLRSLLRCAPDIAVAGEAAGEQEALHLVAASAPDVAVVDLRLRDGCGLELIRRIRRGPCRVVAFTSYFDEQHVHAAVEAGTDAYVLKDADPAELPAAIRAVHAGRRYFSAEASLRLADYIRGTSLTPRETEILALIARGHRNRAISRRLGVAEDTVKGHLKNIHLKLRAATRTEAVMKAIQRGIIRLEDGDNRSD